MRTHLLAHSALDRSNFSRNKSNITHYYADVLIFSEFYSIGIGAHPPTCALFFPLNWLAKNWEGSEWRFSAASSALYKWPPAWRGYRASTRSRCSPGRQGPWPRHRPPSRRTRWPGSRRRRWSHRRYFLGMIRYFSPLAPSIAWVRCRSRIYLVLPFQIQFYWNIYSETRN